MTSLFNIIRPGSKDLMGLIKLYTVMRGTGADFVYFRHHLGRFFFGNQTARCVN